VPYLSALEVCSRQGAIQIHVYLTLPYHHHQQHQSRVSISVSSLIICGHHWSRRFPNATEATLAAQSRRCTATNIKYHISYKTRWRLGLAVTALRTLTRLPYTLGPVSTGMGDCSRVRVAFAPSLYLINHSGKLSLAIPS